MSDNYITKEEVLSFVEEMEKRTHGDDLITKSVLVTTKCVKDFVMHMPTEDVQPVTYCKDCKWRADIKDVDTGEIYYICGVLGFDIPDGFACNQGKRKGVDNEA